MIKTAVVYKLLTKSGFSGGGRAFYNAPHLPLTEEEFLQLEQRIAKESNFKDVYIINIIQLAEEAEHD